MTTPSVANGLSVNRSTARQWPATRAARRLLFVSLLALAPWLTGCESDGLVQPEQLSIPLPDRIRQARAIDPASVSAAVIVNNARTTMQPVAGGFSATVQVPANTTVDVRVEYSEAFGSTPLLLASFSGEATLGTQNGRLELRRSLLNYDLHDDDGDAVNNLTEREQQTDPRDSSQFPQLVELNVLANSPQQLAPDTFNNFFVEATIGGLTRQLQADGNDFAGSFRVPVALPIVARVDFIENTTGESLVIARQSRLLNSVSDQLQVAFIAGSYDTAIDEDNDGQSNLQELLNGTDPLIGAPVTSGALIVEFEVPTEIVDANSIFAQLSIDGVDASSNLNRDNNSFSATVSGLTPGTVPVTVSLLDNFNGQPFTLATGAADVEVTATTQRVVFAPEAIRLDIDTDNDGVLNYIERENGTNPFVAGQDNPVSCSVANPPSLVAAAGQLAILSEISTFVDCAGAPFALTSNDLGFVWNESADTVQWQVPGSAAANSTFDVSLMVVNPDNPSQVYQTASLAVLVSEPGCGIDDTQLTLNPVQDASIEQGMLVNTDELRIDNNVRESVMRFSLDPALGVADTASLLLTVGGDSGSGQISFFVVPDLAWVQTDASLVVPATGSDDLVGIGSAIWQSGQRYQIGLSADTLGSGDLTIVARIGGNSNDVAFASSETNTPPELELSYAGCDES